jgi:hypothetical protein
MPWTFPFTKSVRYHIGLFSIHRTDCERITDLLTLTPNTPLQHKIRESPLLGPHVPTLTTMAAPDLSEFLTLMHRATSRRVTAATLANAQSSRSHAVLSLSLSQHHPTEGSRLSRLLWVDLAGSERAKRTLATGKRLAEGGKINASLTALGKVIQALVQQSDGIDLPSSRRQSIDASSRRPSDAKAKRTPGRQTHIPYRDSVLTFLLKESLGGNAKTTLIANVSPGMP